MYYHSPGQNRFAPFLHSDKNGLMPRVQAPLAAKEFIRMLELLSQDFP
jgi:hypothetical protein